MASPSGWHPTEIAAAIAIGGMLVAALTLSAGAGLAGLLFGDGWAAGSLADMPAVAVRLPDHLGDPRSAWPPAERALLPGALAMYLTFVLMTAAIAAVTGTAIRVFRPARSAEAGWATRRDLSSLAVRRAVRRRIVLGRYRGRLLAAEEHQSALVIAPTQSGKTTALAIPAILEWQGPVIALSVKNDLLRDSLARRADVGRVAVFDPTGSTGLATTSSWTPMLRCRDWAGPVGSQAGSAMQRRRTSAR